jgi:Tol biopolymer transport system component/DNA-binding winged helix-turn-helix (wHTH) protein
MSENSQVVQAPPVRYRFGTFELDGRSAELRRSGVKLRLQEQPFLVLRKLLEGAGALVTREELHGALWPADTFVDFDTSLNTAIKRLREVLGDSADIPVFIETIPRRGYRFLAPVQILQNGKPLSSPLQPQTTASSAPSRRVRLGPLVTSLLLAAVVGATAVRLRSPLPVPRVSDSTQITFDGIPKGNLRARGAYVYFNERLADRITLVRVPTAGGPPVLLDSSISGLYLADVSPDGSKLLVVTPLDPLRLGGANRLRLMDMASGSLQDIDGIDCNDASWAPDGKLVFAKGHDIFLADGDGAHQRKLLSAPADAFFLRFSPDGTRLRFTIGDKAASNHKIWEARADGSNLRQVLTGLTDFPELCCGDWTPDGKYFLFQTFRDGTSRIWAQTEHPPFWSGTLQPVQLTTVPPNFYMGVPTPEKKLVVTAAQPRAELVRYDSASRQYVPFLSGISGGDVQGSRDARSLVYVRYPEGTLWRSKADGSAAAQLTGPSLRASLPHWSPDGTHIAFAGSRPGRPWNIFLIPSAGGPAEQLSSGAISDLDPSWSPDGSKLVFGQVRMVGDKRIDSIQMLDLASRRATPIPGTDGICCPRWSPDGRFLLASHGDYNDLLLYEFATQKWTVIVKDLGIIGYMEWMNDGKSIMFDTLDGAKPAFYRLRLPDLHLETVASLGDVRRYYGDFGPWTGIAPDGSPLLVRDISNEEVYSLELQLP